jgi:hypothetical protein
MLVAATGLPAGRESLFQFTMPRKNELYLDFERALFRNPGAIMQLSFATDHPLADEFKEDVAA